MGLNNTPSIYDGRDSFLSMVLTLERRVEILENIISELVASEPMPIDDDETEG